MDNKKAFINVGTIGEMIACLISAICWKSFGWCIIHAIFGWWYILYFLVVHNDKISFVIETIKGWFV